MSEKNTLVLFTFNSPASDSSEAAFLRVELQYLARKFERIIVLPQVIDHALPVNTGPYELDASLRNMLMKSSSRAETYMSGLFSTVFWSEFFGHLRTFSLKRIRPVLWSHAEGYRICRWLFQFCRHNQIDYSSTLFYTYWLDRSAYALALAKFEFPNIKWVSRVHGIDLYEGRQPLNFFPFREFILKQVNALYCVSENGRDYISSLYPSFKQKYKMSRLGVRSVAGSTKYSQSGIIQIVSCAYIRPVKRMDLMVRGIHSFALKHPHLNVLWDHFGGGDLLDMNFPSNVVVKFWGNVPNHVALDFYMNNPVDVFINTSSSEGIPVSIMEAIANGIPIVAPAIGGIPEIVSDENGILLSPNPSPDEIASALEQFISFSDSIAQKRLVSRKKWQEHYDADRNFDLFSMELLDLLEKS